LTFEEAYARLDEIARALEKDSVPLQQSLDLYQEGQRLVKLCQTMLDEAEKRLRVIQSGEEPNSVKEEIIA